jgi:protein-S-isoprenylcysteine O-methyltransferase Ste14
MRFLPGYDRLVETVPDLSTPRGVLRAVLTPIVIFLAALFLLNWLDNYSPFLAFLLQLVIFGLTYWLLRSFFDPHHHRLAYTDAFYNRFLPSAGLNMAGLVYILTSQGPDAEAARLIPTVLGRLVALYLLVTGIAVLVRAVQAAGLDTLAGLYIYYPEGGRQLDWSIYKLLRHPVYSGVDRLALAFGLWNGSAYAILLAVLYAAVWHPIWYRLEERELVERFGEGYLAYRERVPAVLPSHPSEELRLLEALTRRPAADAATLPDAGG